MTAVSSGLVSAGSLVGFAAADQNRHVERAWRSRCVGRIGARDNQMFAGFRTTKSDFGLLPKALPGDQRNRIGIAQMIGNLVRREQHVQRNDRVAGIVRRVVRDGEMRHVRQEQRHVLTAADSEFRQCAGEPASLSVERVVRKLCFAQDDGRLVRILPSAIAEQRRQIQ